MAEVQGTQSSSKRALFADVNLIPFIDLLSVCICFLLITAVWVQLGVLEVKQAQGTATGPKEGYEVSVTLLGPKSVQMELRQSGRLRKKRRVKGETLLELQEGVAEVTRSFRSLTKDALTTALLTPHQSVDYGHLVAVMDTLRRHEVTNLGVVSPGEVL